MIYFTQETENCFPFQINTKNKFLMSKWHIQRTLIKRALEILKKRWTAQVPLRHTFSAWTLEDRWDNLSIFVWQTLLVIGNLLLIWLITINYDWYTTNYRHAAVYPCATLIVKATVYNKPFTVSWFLKNQLTLFFKFPGQFHNFGDAGTKFQNPGLSWTVRDVTCMNVLHVSVCLFAQT